MMNDKRNMPEIKQPPPSPNLTFMVNKSKLNINRPLKLLIEQIIETMLMNNTLFPYYV